MFVVLRGNAEWGCVRVLYCVARCCILLIASFCRPKKLKSCVWSRWNLGKLLSTGQRKRTCARTVRLPRTKHNNPMDSSASALKHPNQNPNQKLVQVFSVCCVAFACSTSCGSTQRLCCFFVCLFVFAVATTCPLSWRHDTGGGRWNFLRVRCGVWSGAAVHLPQVHGSERLVHDVVEPDLSTFLLRPAIHPARATRLLVRKKANCAWFALRLLLRMITVVSRGSIAEGLFVPRTTVVVVTIETTRSVYSFLGLPK